MAEGKTGTRISLSSPFPNEETPWPDHVFKFPPGNTSYGRKNNEIYASQIIQTYGNYSECVQNFIRHDLVIKQEIKLQHGERAPFSAPGWGVGCGLSSPHWGSAHHLRLPTYCIPMGLTYSEALKVLKSGNQKHHRKYMGGLFQVHRECHSPHMLKSLLKMPEYFHIFYPQWCFWHLIQ